MWKFLLGMIVGGNFTLLFYACLLINNRKENKE